MNESTHDDNIIIHRLISGNDRHFDAMLDLFAEAFDDPDNYSKARPALGYRQALLARTNVVALVALAA